MKYLKPFNESFFPSASSPSYAGSGNSTSTGYTGPVAFHAKTAAANPVDKGQFAQIEDELDDWSKVAVKQTLKNDMQGKRRGRPEDDRFGKSKRRMDKLRAALPSKKSKGIFSDEHDKIENKPDKPESNIKSFSDFTS